MPACAPARLLPPVCLARCASVRLRPRPACHRRASVRLSPARSSVSGSARGFPSGAGAGRPSPPGSFASPAPRHLRRRPRPARVPRAPGTPPAFPVTPRPVSVAAALFHFPLFRHASAAVRFVCARAGNPARRFLPRPARPPAFSIPSRRLSRRRPPFPSRPARFPFLRRCPFRFPLFRPASAPAHHCPFRAERRGRTAQEKKRQKREKNLALLRTIL